MIRASSDQHGKSGLRRVYPNELRQCARDRGLNIAKMGGHYVAGVYRELRAVNRRSRL